MVGQPPTNTATDDQREFEIARLGREMESAMKKSVASGSEYFCWRGEADRLRIQMEALIRSRPPEYVAKLEQLKEKA